MAPRDPGERAAGGAVRHLVRAVEQYETALAELNEHILQCESTSSFLSSLFSPCGHSRHTSPSSCSPSAGRAAPSSSSSSSSASASPLFCSTSLYPRIFVPLTSQALLPGFLLPTSAPPLLHLGESYLATFRLGVPPENVGTSSSLSRKDDAVHRQGEESRDSKKQSTASSADDGEVAQVALRNRGCGALGLIGRRRQLLKMQEGDLRERLKKVKAQLAMATSEDFGDGRAPGEVSPVEESASPAREGCLGDHGRVKGRTHVTKDGFVEIIEEYESEDEGNGPGDFRKQPASPRERACTPGRGVQSVVVRKAEGDGTQHGEDKARCSAREGKQSSSYLLQTTPHERLGKEHTSDEGNNNPTAAGRVTEKGSPSSSGPASFCDILKSSHDERGKRSDIERFPRTSPDPCGPSLPPIAERVVERTADTSRASCLASDTTSTDVPRPSRGFEACFLGADNTVTRERRMPVEGSGLEPQAESRPCHPVKRDCGTGEDATGSSAAQGKKLSLFKALRQQQPRE